MALLCTTTKPLPPCKASGGGAQCGEDLQPAPVPAGQDNGKASPLSFSRLTPSKATGTGYRGITVCSGPSTPALPTTSTFPVTEEHCCTPRAQTANTAWPGLTHLTAQTAPRLVLAAHSLVSVSVILKLKSYPPVIHILLLPGIWRALVGLSVLVQQTLLDHHLLLTGLRAKRKKSDCSSTEEKPSLGLQPPILRGDNP